MVQISDLPQWLSLSSQLIKANPATTRITTKYTIGRKKRKSKAGKESDGKQEKEESTASKRQGTFTIKTHDTVSGSTLVFKTNKAADMGMVMRSMNGLGADLAGIERSKASAVVTAAEAAVEAIKEDEEGATPGQAQAQLGEEGDKSKSKKKKKAKGKK